MGPPPDDSRPAELPHLATFAKAAERGSFTAAAADLGITQAAVSQRIAVLEGELRGSLFDRRAGKMALTEAGQRLYEYARQILDLHEQARMNLGGFHPAVSGDWTIAASSVPGECLLPALLSAFQENYPGQSTSLYFQRRYFGAVQPEVVDVNPI
jgi:DNA-binding transcriptional LysR family regulator